MYLTKLTAIAECWDTYACTRSQKVSALFLVQSLCHCKVGFLHCPKQMWQHSYLRSACNLSCTYCMRYLWAHADLPFGAA